ATTTRPVTRADAILDWSRAAVDLWRQVRAYAEWPQATTWWGQRSLRIRDEHLKSRAGIQIGAGGGFACGQVETERFEIGVGPAARQDFEAGRRGRLQCLAEGPLQHQGVAGRRLKSEAAGGVALRVEVDQQGSSTASGQADGEIDSSGRLAHAALLVGNAENPSHVPRR
ncbi:MAG: hypothetical protein K6T86_19520, partial [Pirellulales bacterium]|nr:hypothetical protein [Pirellulales bacterium]